MRGGMRQIEAKYLMTKLGNPLPPLSYLPAKKPDGNWLAGAPSYFKTVIVLPIENYTFSRLVRYNILINKY